MRDWIALYPSILDSEKWGELPDDTTRLAWVVSILLASRQTTEGRFDSQGQLSRLLRKEGIESPDATVAILLTHGCLDIDGDEVVVRGWDKWQRRWRGPSDDPERKAALERERYWREKAEALETLIASQSGSDLGESGTSLGPSGIEEIRGEDKRGEEATPLPPSSQTETEDRDSQDRYYELTLLRPWGKDSGRWLAEMERGFGVEAVVAAIDAEWKAKPDRKDLLSRVDARLSRDAEKRKAKNPPKRRGTNGVDPEVAARQREALGSMIGKSPGRPPETQEVRDD